MKDIAKLCYTTNVDSRGIQNWAGDNSIEYGVTVLGSESLLTQICASNECLALVQPPSIIFENHP